MKGWCLEERNLDAPLRREYDPLAVDAGSVAYGSLARILGK
jgi:hypothetical protein